MHMYIMRVHSPTASNEMWQELRQKGDENKTLLVLKKVKM